MQNFEKNLLKYFGRKVRNSSFEKLKEHIFLGEVTKKQILNKIIVKT
jgi:hypothetical protein